MYKDLSSCHKEWGDLPDGGVVLQSKAISSDPVTKTNQFDEEVREENILLEDSQQQIVSNLAKKVKVETVTESQSFIIFSI